MKTKSELTITIVILTVALIFSLSLNLNYYLKKPKEVIVEKRTFITKPFTMKYFEYAYKQGAVNSLEYDGFSIVQYKLDSIEFKLLINK